MFVARRIERDLENRHFPRPLEVGEPVRVVSTSGGKPMIRTVDGFGPVVAEEDLALAPLPSTTPFPLDAADLEVRDTAGKVIGGFVEGHQVLVGHQPPCRVRHGASPHRRRG